ncbi:sensor histidine kinase [Seonamhaeicola sp.]|uniref:ligand-binding sensor domain-containing protein n=1 Tax=Seonamhaeicola sp. TaxID=1912245 RepID=UPI002624CDA7|nr:sensor histidine kinase [Seonamhaeicola sp.]
MNFGNAFFYILLLGFISFHHSLYAQHIYEVTRYADDTGLPSRIVRDVIQDSNGFLWIAGNNGLYKFDGQNFKPFFSTLKDTTGLRDNKIIAINETSDRTIWVGTPKGLHTVKENKVSYFQLKKSPTDEENYIKNIITDNNQNVWVNTYGGVFYINKFDRTPVAIPNLIDESIPLKKIDGISCSKNNTIYITSGSNIYINSKNDFLSFKKTNVTYSHGLNPREIIISGIKEFQGQFLLIETNLGLLKGTFSAPSGILIDNFYSNSNIVTATHHIYRVMVDHENYIWIATWKNYFKKYKVEGDYLIEQQVIGSQGHMLNMSGNSMSVFQDDKNNIWIPNTNGLYKLTEFKRDIINFPALYLPDCFKYGLSVYAIAEDHGGNLWVTTPGDLYRFKKSDIIEGKCPKEYIHIKNEQLQFSRNLYIDSKNRLWIGAEGSLGVTQLDENFAPGKFKHFTKLDGLPHNWSFDIHEASQNTFWVCNYAGLVKLTLLNGSLDNTEIEVFGSDPNTPNSLVNAYTTDIDVDGNNNLWIGTFYGVSKLVSSPSKETFTNYTSQRNNYESLSNNTIKQVFNDHEGNLWIGTQKGLNLYNPKTDTFLQLGRKEGLPSEYILGLNQDSKGYLWIATTNGVIKAKFSPKKKSLTNITHYTKNNGLADNITYRNALYIDKQDYVFIGCRNGLSVIAPQTKVKAFNKFNMAITSFRTTKKNTKDFGLIDKMTNYENIELKHFENSIHINYSVLDFTTPKNNIYRHKIVPVQEKWVETDHVGQLSYYNLPPGDYQVILDGSNNQNNWSENPIVIELSISPPFYQSTIAYIIYALLILGSIRYFYLLKIRKRIREVEQKAKLENALIAERELMRQENAADFHDELGSSVTKISMFLTLAERSLDNSEDSMKWLGKIRENVKDLSIGFRDMLWIIDPKKDSLNDSLERLKDYGEDIFNNGNTNFGIRGFHKVPPNVSIDPKTKKHLIMIFKEAMNNSSKYSQGKNILLKVSINKTYFNLELTDDGIGFNLEKKSKGRGLKNMKERAKSINAELEVKSSKDGTKIHLKKIPHLGEANIEKEL